MPEIQTRFAQGKSPWAKPNARHSTKKMQICNDAPPEQSRIVASKYAQLFGRLKPGQAIKCEATAANSVGQAARKWLKSVGKQNDLRVKSMTHYPGDDTDLCGRVWILPKKEAS